LVPTLLLIGALTFIAAGFAIPSSSEASLRVEYAQERLKASRATVAERYARLAHLYKRALTEAEQADNPDEYRARAQAAYDKKVRKIAEEDIASRQPRAAAPFVGIEADSLSAVRELESSQKQLARVALYSSLVWLAGGGTLLLSLATAFLSVWWWFGARAKPKGAQ
jgi:hypothetical protein